MKNILTHLNNECNALNTNFLIGLSGGVDSIVLLWLFNQIMPSDRLRAIHINHQISSNAQDWEDFCYAFCNNLGITIISEKVTLNSDKNLEEQARIARYAAIKNHIKENEMLVTAHHQDDLIETFFLNLKRGSGVKGLGSLKKISFLQNITIFRPLLEYSKNDLITIAKQHNLSWVEDESNLSSKMDRNFLRNEILPLLKDRWSGFANNVAKTARHCQEQEELIKELLSQKLVSHIDKQKRTLNLAIMQNKSKKVAKALIRLFLDHFNIKMPSEKQLDEIVNLTQMNNDNKAVIYLDNITIRLFDNHLYICELNDEIKTFTQEILKDQQYNLPYNLGSIIYQHNRIMLNNNEYELPQKLLNARLHIILGARGKVKLYRNNMTEQMKKIYQQHHIEPWLRSQILSLFIDDKWFCFLKTK